MVKNVVAILERFYSADLAEVRVIQEAQVATRTPERVRPVDILVEIPVGPRIIRVGIDVWDKSGPVDAKTIGALAAKWADVRGVVDRFCVVSTSGFAARAREDAKLAGIETFSLDELKPDGTSVSLITSQVRHAAASINWSGREDPIVRGAFEREFQGKGIHQIELVFQDGRSSLLESVLQNLGAQVLTGLPLPGFGVGEFTVTVNCQSAGWKELRFSGARLPAPEEWIGTFQTRLDKKAVPALRFQHTFGAYAVATAWEIAGEKQQATLIFDPVSGGSHGVRVFVTIANPEQVNIP